MEFVCCGHLVVACLSSSVLFFIMFLYVFMCAVVDYIVCLLSLISVFCVVLPSGVGTGGAGGPGPPHFLERGARCCLCPPVFDRFKFYILTERVTNSQMITKELIKTR